MLIAYTDDCIGTCTWLSYKQYAGIDTEDSNGISAWAAAEVELMTCSKCCVYPLLLSLITILAASGPAAASDIQRLVHALAGRLAQLDQGTIHYKYYKFKCTPDVFRKIKDAFDQNAAGVSGQARNDRIRALLYGPSIDSMTAYRGTIYYEAHGKQWRFVKKTIDQYGHNMEKLEKRAAKLSNRLHGKKVKLILPAVDQDVSYDGKTLLNLENNTTLIKSRVKFAMAYPTIQSLDISLAPWYMAMESAPPANQTITVKAQGSVWSIAYLDRLTGGRITNVVNQNVVCEFDAARGFAPVRVYGTDNNKIRYETLFHCHRERGNENEYTVDSVLTCHYPAAKQAKLSGEVYLINSWSNKIAEKDLKLKLPGKYILIDESSGAAKPIVKIIGRH